ncbi:SDR family NAD(P)-dependent oxidoreductase [Metabacillus idriensis]|uniref:SDR family NAD(P)-dependent oxidoreductase n=1 Tax=Metabacillus idriensis TaxID=324768 RepID=UPI002812E53F|nr:SDR family NAD(P)-dependent oxidoreductase [Metabacillus idriensis]MDR0137504.1 SDR family NAD(P)-dependent oxidoreductase [Metabacillus idriensis]
MEKLKGQVAIVTGGSRGIGAGIAYRLAGEGAHIVIVDVLEASEMIDKVTNHFPDIQVRSHQADIRDIEAIQTLVDETIQEFGRIDILVNNAGTCSRFDLEEMTEDMWDQDLNTNLKATFFFMQKVVYPHMISRNYGRIINISSISGMNGGAVSSFDPDSLKGRSGPAYAASKGGVIALTKWAAKELGSTGITCNSVAPGAVESAITKGMAYNLDNQVVKRMGLPEDIAEAVCYFSLPEASYTTGQVLRVCGGAVFA